MNRLLKYINIVLAFLLVAVFAATWWYAVRPLADTSGRVPAPLAAAASATRDELGVPHIQAKSVEDALFVQGYITAQDRLWQMDLTRRVANGEVAEIFGAVGLESDRDARRLRIRRIAESAAAALPAAEQAALAAYARGVNVFIDTHLNRLPVEFRLLDYDPRPWRVADSIAVGLQMFRTLTTRWRDELDKLTLRQAGDPARVDFLFPIRGLGDFQPGSNAWAVSGSRTASGRPILAGDMHLEASIPSVWYMAHVQSPGLNVTGFSLPGLPGIVAGHNERIAWSCTNLGFDVQDLVEIEMDERTGQYLYQGKPEQARPEQEVIRVHGAKPAEVMVWVTRHGPLFLAEGKQRFALRWTAEGVGASAFPFLDLNRARNWNEFNQALSRFPGPAQTFVYADVDGNIGYHVAGKLPVRKGFAGDVPSNGQTAWEGFIPFDQLPSALNPPSGMIVSANQNPFPQDYPYTVSGSFAPSYRAAQIRNLLNAKKGWKASDMLPVQMDVYSEFSRFLAREVVRAFDRRKPGNAQLPDAVALLRGWNGQMEYDIAPPFLTSLLFQHLRRAIANAAAPKGGASYQTAMSAAVVERLLRERPTGWVKDWDETLIRALDDAVAEGGRMQGREPSRWKYGNYLTMAIRHPIGARLPWYITQPLQFWWLVTPWRSYENYKFDVGPEPMSGAATTVKAVSPRNMPSMRMVVDLANLDSSLANIPTGQSGQILSPHYKDQWKSHYYGRSFPMEFRNVKAEDVLDFVPGSSAGK